MESLTLKCDNYFQKKKKRNNNNNNNNNKNNNRKATHSLVPTPLAFNDICVSSISPKTNLETNFLNIENRNFEYVSFSK